MNTEPLKRWYQYTEMKFIIVFAVIFVALVVTICWIAYVQPKDFVDGLIYTLAFSICPAIVAKDMLRNYRKNRRADIYFFESQAPYPQGGGV